MNRHAWQRDGWCGLLFGLVLSGSGCAVAPDHCENYALACINVTVETGPDGVYRLQVNTSDGVDPENDATVLTPKKLPQAPLVYPLRFGIELSDFSDLYQGQVSLLMRALDADFVVIGAVSTTVAIMKDEKKSVSLNLSPGVTGFDMGANMLGDM